MESQKSDLTVELTGLALLRAPFKPHQISKLPKPLKKDSPKGKCPECGGYHGLPAIHLDYVGHAALTDRLLDVDPNWNWEPLAFDANGVPFVDKDGGMWIKLTVLGKTRLGYGDSGGKTGADATKERIGDALRNAAMRFGAALDLWHKGNLHEDEEQSEPKTEPKSYADLITAIDSSQTIDELKVAFEQAKNFARNELMLNQFIEAKDLRKTQLMTPSLKNAQFAPVLTEQKES